MERFVDIALIAVIIICVWAGYKKGLIMGIGGILAIIISLYGARIISSAFSYEIIPAARPFVAGYMETQFKLAVYDELGIELPEEDEEETLSATPEDNARVDESEISDERLVFSIDDLINQNPGIEKAVYAKALNGIGVFNNPSNKIAEKIIQYEEQNGADKFNSMVTTLCNELSFVLGFLLSFSLILIILTVIGNILNISFKIPRLDLLNDIGGAVFGLLTGLFFCSMLAWALNFTGIIIDEDKIMDTWLASSFINNDLIGKFIGL